MKKTQSNGFKVVGINVETGYRKTCHTIFNSKSVAQAYAAGKWVLCSGIREYIVEANNVQ